MTGPYYTDDRVTLWHGDCLDVLRELADASVDAVVTDPPYGLEFMGKAWDSFGRGEAQSGATAGMAATGYADGTHRLERPSFLGGINPRCLSCGRSQRGGSPCRCDSPSFTDERGPRLRAFQAWCEQWAAECLRVLKPGGFLVAFGGARTAHRLTSGIEDAGFEIRDGMVWLYGSGFPKSLNVGEGRGTALKPANEPIVVARKPLVGTVAANLLIHGTGALNIDACRVATGESTRRNNAAPRFNGDSYANGEVYAPEPWTSGSDSGRWPANVVLSHVMAWDGADACAGPDGCVRGCPVAELDAQSGVSRDGVAVQRNRPGGTYQAPSAYGVFGNDARPDIGYGGAGGASRFFPVFRYEAKAPTSQRPRADGAAHPTVKPLDLMRWLVRLVTPSGGTVLEPFAGSGTTAEACVIEGMHCIAVERDATYLPLIVARLTKPLQPALDLFGAGEEGAA